MNVLIWMTAYFCVCIFFMLIVTKCDDKDLCEKIEAEPIPSSELIEKILWYKQLINPKFAFMVVGAWGCGKTYSIKHGLNESDYYYVSLFNLNSVEEVRNNILSQTTVGRKIGNTVANVINDFGKNSNYLGWLSLVKYGWNFLADKYLVKNRLLILDDLERSSLLERNINLLMGVIDFYVQIGCHVVVVCNEDFMPEKFKEIKEKVFGYTYKFSANIDQVENNFYHDLSDKDLLLINPFSSVLRDVWVKSNCESYRIFRHMLTDGVLLLNAIGSDVENKRELSEFLKFFWIMNVEFRVGHIEKENFYERDRAVVGVLMSEGNEHSALLDIQEKYNIRIDRQWIADNILENMICNGIFLDNEIKNSLDIYTEIYKSKLEDWRVLFQPGNYAKSKLAEANDRIVHKLNNKYYFELGELLHLAAIYLDMSNSGEIDWEMKDVVVKFRYVIEEICGTCSEVQNWIFLIENSSPSVFETYDGFAYVLNDATRPFFDEIVSCVKTNIHKYKKNILSQLIWEVLLTVKDDIFEFENMLKSDMVGTLNVANEPILSYLNAKEFVKIWLASDNPNAGRISNCLDLRYTKRNINFEFKEEVQWLLDVSESFDREYNKSEGLERYRLDKIKPRIFSIVKKYR